MMESSLACAAEQPARLGARPRPGASIAGAVRRLLLLLVSCAPCAGCCGIAGYFCGPDRSRWVQREYRTPESALETFLEAVRRERTEVIAEALSEGARRHYGLIGIRETTLAWERLKGEVPALHLLGEATIPPLRREPDGRMRATIRVAGEDLTLWLIEQPFWVAYYRLEGEPGLERQGSYVDERTFQSMVVVVASDLQTTIDARVRDDRLPELTAAQLRELRFGHDWKIDRFEIAAPM